jgi:hypothetical protein
LPGAYFFHCGQGRSVGETAARRISIPPGRTIRQAFQDARKAALPRNFCKRRIDNDASGIPLSRKLFMVFLTTIKGNRIKKGVLCRAPNQCNT